ncbi:carbon-nitrogen hydrolase family protein [Microbacterium invictum]|uniref:Carbon-nitrogen hydrolase family protein n=1 Tax=Microbacterium invictum TaxID=515415 RepID=A0ABZ0VDZ1_9MICO|nr:carbon-nitrogen hydrolase family protein [Microbacterium invictum]WQB71831.1 carbon-nitrogen hydrolase family protein [Microbacterium invictum]
MNVDSRVLTAVAQFGPTADSAANRRRVAELVRSAATQGARVVVLPEYSNYFIDPFDASLDAHAETLDGPFVSALQQLAAQTRTCIVAGLLERGDAHRVRNTVVAVTEAGPIAVYRKIHLYDAFGQRESDWIQAGETTQPQTFVVGGIRFGLMTCYDLRFPEMGRILADAGATAFLVPAEWVRGPLKEHHWQTLLQARAIENTAYVVAADHPPPLGVGLSGVIDPQGVTVAGVGSGTGIALAHLDPGLVAGVREQNPALRLRRFRVIADSPQPGR